MINRLEFDSIEIAFDGRSLLKSIHMVCETGKVTGLLGRNGCGKSTLMKIAFGAMPCEQKSVRVNGASLGLNYLSRKAIAYLPQEGLIPQYLTMRKAFSLFQADEKHLTDRFPETSSMMHLQPAELSGGYLRIFEVVLILHSRAMFCFLDEPFTGLTPVYIEKIKQLILERKSEKGIVISDHMHKHVSDISDTLYLLANGQTYHVTERERLVSLGYLSHL
ncbi:MAG TPA: ATP-binding cassette domain-containing protein [Chryseosolibacter sp.]|nr:ATP-binding cassette domain-containing protein [Chryseosolibacter sp.]